MTEKAPDIRFSSLIVFGLFFGLALIQAIGHGDWLSAGLFTALGLLSLWADLKKS